MSNEPIVLLVDPRVLAIPIAENGDPLFDLRDQSKILFGPSPEIENNLHYAKMRFKVYEKLLDAQKQLPSNFQFCVYEALRTTDLQKQIYEERRSLLKRHRTLQRGH